MTRQENKIYSKDDWCFQMQKFIEKMESRGSDNKMHEYALHSRLVTLLQHKKNERSSQKRQARQ